MIAVDNRGEYPEARFASDQTTRSLPAHLIRYSPGYNHRDFAGTLKPLAGIHLTAKLARTKVRVGTLLTNVAGVHTMTWRAFALFVYCMTLASAPARGEPFGSLSP